MKKWYQNLTANYPFLKFLGNRYTLVLIFFIVWMLFLDNQSLWDQRSLNKQINELEDNKKYYKEDGLSFGVGDDSGYIYTAEARPATEEESKSIRDEIENKNKNSQENTQPNKPKKIKSKAKKKLKPRSAK